MSAVRAELSPGRWHFQHGPIDLIIQAAGQADVVAEAVERAWGRFSSVLTELVQELPLLREPVRDEPCALQGEVARRMWQACRPFLPAFITPMAAVAGSVAQELIAAFQRNGIDKALINNGGDIALWLAPGASLRVGVCSDPTPRGLDALRTESETFIELDSSSAVRGIATSGWRGRSFSFGLADSVTVLASSAAMADAAATMVANAVNCDSAQVQRQPASSLTDWTDLGDRLVTTQVGPLDRACVDLALDRGVKLAGDLVDQGLIISASLALQGQTRTVNQT